MRKESLINKVYNSFSQEVNGLKRLRKNFPLMAIALVSPVLLSSCDHPQYASTPDAGGCYRYHLVKYGETATEIAEMYNMPLWELALMNPRVNLDHIIAGVDKLCVKPQTVEEATCEAEKNNN